MLVKFNIKVLKKDYINEVYFSLSTIKYGTPFSYLKIFTRKIPLKD